MKILFANIFINFIKVFTSVNLSKIFIIFCTGFIMRIFINFFFSVNVFVDYLTVFSISFYSFMAFFSVFINDFFNFYSISIIPNFITKFLYSLFKVFSISISYLNYIKLKYLKLSYLRNLFRSVFSDINQQKAYLVQLEKEPLLSEKRNININVVLKGDGSDESSSSKTKGAHGHSRGQSNNSNIERSQTRSSFEDYQTPRERRYNLNPFRKASTGDPNFDKAADEWSVNNSRILFDEFISKYKKNIKLSKDEIQNIRKQLQNSDSWTHTKDDILNSVPVEIRPFFETFLEMKEYKIMSKSCQPNEKHYEKNYKVKSSK